MSNILEWTVPYTFGRVLSVLELGRLNFPLDCELLRGWILPSSSSD